MKINRESMIEWLATRNKRESMFIYIMGFLVVYFLWNVMFELPLHAQTESLEKENQALRTQVGTEAQQLQVIELAISNKTFVHEMAIQRQLSGQTQSMGKELKNMRMNFIPLEWLTKVTNDIIAKQSEVTLLSLKTFPEEPWILPKTLSGDLAVKDMQDVFKHKMQIEFRGTYFNVIEFLSHLEKLPWNIYWESLDYKVLSYPEADVVAQFYVLSNQKA